MTKTERAVKAKTHVQFIQRKYMDEIKNSADHSFVQDIMESTNALPDGNMSVNIAGEDSVSAIMHGTGKKQCILNFASFTSPGGGFINGSIAQEEALCHASTLYPVLSYSKIREQFYEKNRGFINNGLYSNRLVFSPDIVFISDGDILPEDASVKCDVITCACPNWGFAKQNGMTEEDNIHVLRRRIDFVLNFTASRKTDRVILGAFGCGVFGQDPFVVAGIFKDKIEEIFTGKQIEIVFAIPHGNGNLEAFETVFKL